MWVEIYNCLSNIGKAVVVQGVEVFQHSADFSLCTSEANFKQPPFQNEEFPRIFPSRNVEARIRSLFD